MVTMVAVIVVIVVVVVTAMPTTQPIIWERIALNPTALNMFAFGARGQKTAITTTTTIEWY